MKGPGSNRNPPSKDESTPEVMLSPKATKWVAPAALTGPSESPGASGPLWGTLPRDSTAPEVLGEVGVWEQRAAVTANTATHTRRPTPGRKTLHDMPW